MEDHNKNNPTYGNNDEKKHDKDESQDKNCHCGCEDCHCDKTEAKDQCQCDCGCDDCHCNAQPEGHCCD